MLLILLDTVRVVKNIINVLIENIYSHEILSPCLTNLREVHSCERLLIGPMVPGTHSLKSHQLLHISFCPSPTHHINFHFTIGSKTTNLWLYLLFIILFNRYITPYLSFDISRLCVDRLIPVMLRHAIFIYYI